MEAEAQAAAEVQPAAAEPQRAVEQQLEPEQPPTFDPRDYITDYNPRKFDDATRALFAQYFADEDPDDVVKRPVDFWAPLMVQHAALTAAEAVRRRNEAEQDAESERRAAAEEAA